MLNKKISEDYAVNSLSCDTSRLLFSWIIAHLDVNGCFFGDPKLVKNKVFPLRDEIKVKKIEQFLKEMEQLGLIITYKVDEIPYIYYPSFDKNQPGLRKDREANSDIPPYPQNDGVNPVNIQQNSDTLPEVLPPNRSISRSIIEVEVERESKEKEKETLTPSPLPGWLLLLTDSFPDFKPKDTWIDTIERDWNDVDLNAVTEEFLSFWKGRKIVSVEDAFMSSLRHARDYGVKRGVGPNFKDKYGHLVER